MIIQANGLPNILAINSKNTQNVINFTSKKDDFTRLDAPLLPLNGKRNDELERWAQEFISLPGSSKEHLHLLSSVLAKSMDDEETLAKILFEVSCIDSPQKICEDMKDYGVDLLSLSKEEVREFQKNVDNFSKDMVNEDADYESFVLLPFLNQQQLKKVDPYVDDDLYARLLFDIANGDEEFFQKLNEYSSFVDLYRQRLNVRLKGADFQNIMRSSLDKEIILGRLTELAEYTESLDARMDSPLYITSNTFSNLSLASDDKWKLAKYFMALKNSIPSGYVNFCLEDIDRLSNMSKEEFKSAQKLINCPRMDYAYLAGYEILDFVKLTPNQQERAIKYLSTKVNNQNSSFGYTNYPQPRVIYDLVNLDEKKSDFIFSNFKYLEDQQIKTYVEIYTNPDLLSLPLAKRIDLASEAEAINASFDKFGIVDTEFKNISAKLQGSLSIADVSLDVPKINIVQLFKTFLSNIKVGETQRADFNPNLSYSDNILTINDDFIKSFGRSGLPLTYSRDAFLSDLDDLTKTLPKEKRNDIFHKLSIVPKFTDDKLDGYNGLLAIKNLDLTDSVDKSVYDIAYKFLYSNAVNTGNEELDKELNTIIKAFPEFLNSIGKLQNPTHRYSNDIHTLAVLNNCISNPKYQELNQTSKTAIKLLALFHDLGKADSVVDKGHQNTSAYYVKSILGKLNIGEDMSDRIYELVKNHHWFEEYNTGTSAPEYPAFMFRRPYDFDIAQIFARADLLGVGASMFADYCDDLNEEHLAPIKEKINKIYSTGNAVYSSNIVLEDKIPREIDSDGSEYKVINFTQIPDDADLSQFGFVKGLKKDDVKLLVHMIGGEYDLSRFTYLSDINNAGVLSESLISLKHKRTYCRRKYGLVLSNSPYNVIQMSDSNIGSGTKKDFDYAVKTIQRDSERLNFKHALLNQLGLSEAQVSDEEYSEFYRKFLINKNMISQFGDKITYNLGGHEFSSSELKSALACVMDSFMIKDENDEDKHCEFVAYFPRMKGVVAKENSLEDVPQYLKDFAKQYDLPVFLIGKD